MRQNEFWAWECVMVMMIAGCGSPSIESTRAPDRTIEERAEPTPAAPTAEEVLAALGALTATPEGTCAEILEDPDMSLGAMFSAYIRDAETKEVSCTPGATGGFRCRVQLVNNRGGEGGEWAIFVELALDGNRTIDPTSITCDFAG